MVQRDKRGRVASMAGGLGLRLFVTPLAVHYVARRRHRRRITQHQACDLIAAPMSSGCEIWVSGVDDVDNCTSLNTVSTTMSRTLSIDHETKNPLLPGVPKLPRTYIIRVEEGTHGYHSIIEDASGRWRASKISAQQAVVDCVAAYILAGVMHDAEEIGLHASVDTIQIGAGLWKAICSAVPAPGHSGVSLGVEARGAAKEIETRTKRRINDDAETPTKTLLARVGIGRKKKKQ